MSRYPVPTGGGSVTVQQGGSSVGTRPIVNFTSGATATDNPGANRVDVAVSGGGGGGHTIQDEGVSLTQRAKLNFVGAGVTATDGGAGPDSTIVTIPGLALSSATPQADGVAGAAGSGTAAVRDDHVHPVPADMRHLIDPVTYPPPLRDDFYTVKTTAAQIGELRWNYSTFTVAGTQAGEPVVQGHPGVVALASSTTAACTLYPGNSNLLERVQMQDVSRFTWILSPQAATADFRVQVGVAVISGIPNPANGAWFERAAADTNWQCVCANTSVQTKVDSGVAFTATNWYRLQARIVGGNWIFSINGTDVATISTNQPSATASVTWFFAVDPNGLSGSCTTQIDYFDVWFNQVSR